MKKNHQPNNQNGFTLVELLVSLAIFSIVVVASLGAMLSIADANRRVQKTRAVLDNLSLSMESMSRNLRLGSTYHCETVNTQGEVDTLRYGGTINSGQTINIAQPCTGGWGNYIAFEDQYGSPVDNNDQGYYYLDKDPASPTKDRIMYKRYSSSGAVPLTSDDLRIRSLRIYVTGLTAGEQQPKAIISVSGITEVGKAQEPVEVNLQTTVSQRALNL